MIQELTELELTASHSENSLQISKAPCLLPLVPGAPEAVEDTKSNPFDQNKWAIPYSKKLGGLFVLDSRIAVIIA